MLIDRLPGHEKIMLSSGKASVKKGSERASRGTCHNALQLATPQPNSLTLITATQVKLHVLVALQCSRTVRTVQYLFLGGFLPMQFVLHILNQLPIFDRKIEVLISSLNELRILSGVILLVGHFALSTGGDLSHFSFAEQFDLSAG